MLPPDLAHDMLSLNQGERRCSREGAEMQPSAAVALLPLTQGTPARRTGLSSRPTSPQPECSARVHRPGVPRNALSVFLRVAGGKVVETPNHSRNET